MYIIDNVNVMHHGQHCIDTEHQWHVQQRVALASPVSSPQGAWRSRVTRAMVWPGQAGGFQLKDFNDMPAWHFQ